MQSKPSVHEAALHVFWMMVRVLCNCGQELASLGTGGVLVSASAWVNPC